MKTSWNRMGRIRLFPLLFQNGCSQSSQFLPQARRIVGSGDENACALEENQIFAQNYCVPQKCHIVPTSSCWESEDDNNLALIIQVEKHKTKWMKIKWNVFQRGETLTRAAEYSIKKEIFKFTHWGYFGQPHTLFISTYFCSFKLIYSQVLANGDWACR